MDDIKKERAEALKVTASLIGGCEGTRPKFAEGTAQDSLLKNRLQALYLAKALLAEEASEEDTAKEKLTAALRPIDSIISKCEKAQGKFAVGSGHYNRFQGILHAMALSKRLIEEELAKKGQEVQDTQEK